MRQWIKRFGDRNLDFIRIVEEKKKEK